MFHFLLLNYLSFSYKTMKLFYDYWLLYSFQFPDYAFLRSLPHVEAMLTCVKAFEIGDYELLSQIDDVLVSKIHVLISGFLDDFLIRT